AHAGIDVPVREEPVRVLHEQADAVDAVRLGEDEPLLLEDARGHLAGKVLRRFDLLFFAQRRRSGPRWGGRLTLFRGSLHLARLARSLPGARRRGRRWN